MKLGLGTAQFGMDYGISNKHGKILPQEVRKIIEVAKENDIDLIDTANLYSDSESVLGKSLPANHKFKIITKTPVFNVNNITAVQVERLRTSFNRSLEKLRQDYLYGLLIHNPDDLLTSCGTLLIEEMQNIRKQKLVEKIGISIYTNRQIDQVLNLFNPDIVQIPINIFDQRLLESGHLVKLKNMGIEIHARSVFLQGLLLMEPEDLQAYFSPIRERFIQYNRFLESNHLTKLQAALLFANQINEIDVVVVGVTSASELNDIIVATDIIKSFRYIDMSVLKVADENMINPSKWKRNISE
jgi:aryl-alcohol dehydrogenase-like predicted oxidoreductase